MTSLASTPDPGRSKTELGSLAERVFAGLYHGWKLIPVGGHVIVVPRGTPVIAAASLSDAVGRISGTAPSRCPRGTGWPAGVAR